MNKSQELNLENERKECSNIFEVLSHIAIFKPLVYCVFSETKDEFWIQYWRKENREVLLRSKWLLFTILNHFKNENNLIKFTEEVDKFYLKNRESLDKLWINDSHKNMYSIAIATIKEYVRKNNNEQGSVDKWELYQYTNLSFVNEERNLEDEINRIFLKIIDAQYDIDKERIKKSIQVREIIWDISGNLAINDNEWKIENLYWVKVALVAWRYINVATRKPIIIKSKWEKHYITEIFYEKKQNWEDVIKVKLWWLEYKIIDSDLNVSKESE